MTHLVYMIGFCKWHVALWLSAHAEVVVNQVMKIRWQDQGCLIQ